MTRAVFYINKQQYNKLRAVLLFQGISVSEWLRRKAGDEILQWEKRHNAKMKLVKDKPRKTT